MIARLDPFTSQSILLALTLPGHQYEFSLKVTQAQSEQQSKFQSKIINSCLLGGTSPQLQMDLNGLIPYNGQGPLMLGKIKSH